MEANPRDSQGSAPAGQPAVRGSAGTRPARIADRLRPYARGPLAARLRPYGHRTRLVGRRG